MGMSKETEGPEFVVTKEDMEFAAKAAGIGISWDDQYKVAIRDIFREDEPLYGAAIFDPVDDDGDSFRLAVKLNLEITVEDERCGCVSVAYGDSYDMIVSENSESPDTAAKATRIAIFRAAVEIGRAMP